MRCINYVKRSADASFSTFRWLFVMCFLAAPAFANKTISEGPIGSDKIIAVTDERMTEARADFGSKLEQMESRWSLATEDAIRLVDQEIKAQMTALGITAREILMDRTRQLNVLYKASTRLQVAARHGVFGKCCCARDSLGGCSWRDAGHHFGRDHQRCPDNEDDYDDHAADTTGRSLDALLDVCAQSPEWRRAVEGEGEHGADEYEDDQEDVKKALAELQKFQDSLKM
mmetsp:Transcript_59330/g.94195  ORF Transcript_59330/g.94195 Transcript_59330/m.94195 type:complete len:229 (+) Transcript_59330:106-792(+)